MGEIEIPEHRQRRQALDAAQKHQQLRECPRGHHQLLAFDQLAINEQRIAGGSLVAFGFAALGISHWSRWRLGLIALKDDASGSRFHRQLREQGVELIGARHDLQQAGRLYRQGGNDDLADQLDKAAKQLRDNPKKPNGNGWGSAILGGAAGLFKQLAPYALKLMGPGLL